MVSEICYRQTDRLTHRPTDKDGNHKNSTPQPRWSKSIIKQHELYKLDLVANQVSSSDYSSARNKAVQYLESNLRSVSSDPYALSIITYALTLASSSAANSALEQLNRLATNEGLTTAFMFDLHCFHYMIHIKST